MAPQPDNMAACQPHLRRNPSRPSRTLSSRVRQTQPDPQQPPTILDTGFKMPQPDNITGGQPNLSRNPSRTLCSIQPRQAESRPQQPPTVLDAGFKFPQPDNGTASQPSCKRTSLAPSLPIQSYYSTSYHQQPQPAMPAHLALPRSSSHITVTGAARPSVVSSAAPLPLQPRDATQQPLVGLRPYFKMSGHTIIDNQPHPNQVSSATPPLPPLLPGPYNRTYVSPYQQPPFATMQQQPHFAMPHPSHGIFPPQPPNTMSPHFVMHQPAHMYYPPPPPPNHMSQYYPKPPLPPFHFMPAPLQTPPASRQSTPHPGRQPTPFQPSQSPALGPKHVSDDLTRQQKRIITEIHGMELTGNGANGSFWEMLCEVTKEYGMVNKSEAAAPSAPSIAASAPSEDTVMKDAVEKSVKKPAEVEKKLLGAPSAENRVDGTSPDYKAAMLVLQSEIFLTGLGKNIFKELLRDIRVLGLYVYEKDPVMRQFLLEELLSEKGLRSDTLERCFAMRL